MLTTTTYYPQHPHSDLLTKPKRIVSNPDLRPISLAYSVETMLALGSSDRDSGPFCDVEKGLSHCHLWIRACPDSNTVLTLHS